MVCAETRATAAKQVPWARQQADTAVMPAVLTWKMKARAHDTAQSDVVTRMVTTAAGCEPGLDLLLGCYVE